MNVVMNMSKKISYQTEEQKELFHFLIVLGVVVFLVLIVYFVSKAFIVDKSLFEVNYVAGEINEERAIVGTMFNRPETEYYVMAYHEEDSGAVYYSSLSSKYTNSQAGALKVYHIDLGNALNSKYFVGSDKESNRNATTPSEVKLKELTLIKIKNGKIVKYLENISDIEKELAVTKEK